MYLFYIFWVRNTRIHSSSLVSLFITLRRCNKPSSRISLWLNLSTLHHLHSWLLWLHHVNSWLGNLSSAIFPPLHDPVDSTSTTTTTAQNRDHYDSYCSSYPYSKQGVSVHSKAVIH